MDEPTPRVVMRAEVGAESPLWDERGEMVWLDSLGLPPDLQHALTKWADVAWQGDDEVIDAEGRRLHGRVVQPSCPPRSSGTTTEDPVRTCCYGVSSTMSVPSTMSACPTMS